MRGTFSSMNNGTQSPKRKTTNLLPGESPLKRHKVSPNFSKSLSFWKLKEGGNLYPRTEPNYKVVRDFLSNNYEPDRTIRQDQQVVTYRDSPGGESGSRFTDMQPGGGASQEHI